MAKDAWSPRPVSVPSSVVRVVPDSGELYDDVELGGAVEQVPADVRLMGAVVTGLRAVGLQVDRWAVQDVLVAAPDLSGMRFGAFSAHRLRVEGGRLSGSVLPGALLQDVVLTDVHAPGLTVRGATLRSCTFTGCAFEDLDLGGSTLDHVTFRGCDLTALQLHGVTVASARFLDCTFERVAAADRLRGAAVDAHGLLQLAPSLAQALGITVG